MNEGIMPIWWKWTAQLKATRIHFLSNILNGKFLLFLFASQSEELEYPLSHFKSRNLRFTNMGVSI